MTILEEKIFWPKKDDIIVDIGAAIGDYSLIAAKLGAKVIAIEPSPKSFPILLKNIKLNKMEDKINPIRCALSSKEGTLTVSIDETSGYIHPSTLAKGIRVPTKTLDSLLKELNIQKIDLIKMDTEGFEYEILEGASEVISKFKPKMIIEVHSKELREKVIKFLLLRNYSLVYEKVNFYEPLISVLYFAPYAREFSSDY